MGITYIAEESPRPFVPAKIEFAKKKAKELRAEGTELKLSECQQAIAKALGWKDWFTLEQAVKQELPPSPADEETDAIEVRRRRYSQFEAIFDLGFHYSDAENISAKLGLTCSPATARARMSDVGPWGGFQDEAEEIAPGILLGECAKFSCYRLSAARQKAMHPLCRMDSWQGWYMTADHAWRVVLSFQSEFSAEQIQDAWDSAEQAEPFIFELLKGAAPNAEQRFTRSEKTTVAELIRDAEANQESWFAVSNFEDWALRDAGKLTEADNQFMAVSAVKGRDLLRLLNEQRGEARGTWDDVTVRWLVVRSQDALERARKLSLEMPAMRLTGLYGWDHKPVAKSPVKMQFLSTRELDFGSSWHFESLVNVLNVSGQPTVIA